MKRQTIYPLFIAALTLIIVLDVNAQTKEGNVSEARIRRLLSQDGNDNKAIQFSGATMTRAQTLSVNPKLEVSPNSPQELRALIFENYTPPGAKGVALRSAATPKQATGGAGAGKLPSEMAAAEAAEVQRTAAPVQVPPTQGEAKEEQQ
ncbi:hypothetical protein GCM10007415_38430 [Parapedobacter pyrenivorans]|uniref:Uncharacterized protein n=1 Tax=Parapedobacter pyrenivorans TaxID=1305674 RepID=A0A917I016_9SPHI|nr:hypothetical protein [Parapedobacter pyrenivorans]GGG99038.1 hypothetical protein GCM10007415_38430 [Parapedobacter pyrenivorans]